MKRKIITIENGKVEIATLPIWMTIDEIAALFDLYYPETKKCIRAIEKSNIVSGNYSMSGTVEGLKVYPDYYGLDMVIAVAFRVQSPKADIFRKWICQRVTHVNIQSAYSLLMQNVELN